MADVVTGPTILQQNDNRVVIKIVNQSDGSGGTTVFGDVSAMAARQDGTSVAHLALMRVWFSCLATIAETSPKTVVPPDPSD